MKKGKNIKIGDTILNNGQRIKLAAVSDTLESQRYFVYFSECVKNEVCILNEKSYVVEGY